MDAVRGGFSYQIWLEKIVRACVKAGIAFVITWFTAKNIDAQSWGVNLDPIILENTITAGLLVTSAGLIEAVRNWLKVKKNWTFL